MVDLLGDVLLSLKIDANSIGAFHADAVWGFSVPPMHASIGIVYRVIDGPCWLLRDGADHMALSAGDTVLTLHGCPVSLASAPDAPLIPFVDLWHSQGLPELGPDTKRGAPIRFGLGGARAPARLLTIAYVLREPTHSPLLSVLPSIIVLKDDGKDVFPWLPAALDLIAAEGTASRPGYIATATRLAEFILTSILRAHILATPPETAGWLRGLTDARIGKALAALHARPGASWTVPLLAFEAGMSRASFARHFSHLMSVAPMEYLVSWRMQRASEMVLAGAKSIAMIAEEMGYSSESAFRSAFKQRFGMPPLRYAKAERTRSADELDG